VKVKIVNPDEYLKPEMNSSVAFVAKEQPKNATAAAPVITIPSSAVKNNAVFVVADEKAVRRAIKTSGSTSQGVRVEQGLNGGEDLIVNPPADLKDGTKVKVISR
jgi:HlyD family secretion protein